MQIVDLHSDDQSAVEQAAALLVDLLPEGWSTMESALREVAESFPDERISRIAREGEEVVGWIGGQERYAGHLWELHPLVVRRERQRQGIGRALVEDLEEHVRARGAHTILVAADYEPGIDLYANVLEHLRGAKNVRDYQYEFYERCGYVIVGVVPDANGFSNIYMAKRIVPLTRQEGASNLNPATTAPSG